MVSGINAQDATESNAIRERVKEKIEAAVNSPKAFIGSITDIVDVSIQIENGNGEIEQITTSDNTSVVKVNSKSTAQKVEDIAIGDFVIAMGFLDENSVLDSERILIITEPDPPARKTIFGKVKEVDKKIMTITNTQNQDLEITFPRAWKGPNLDELEIETKIVVVVKPDDDGDLTVRTVEIIS